MACRISRTLTSILAFTLLCSTFAEAQEQVTHSETPAADKLHTWEVAQFRAPAGRKVQVVTIAQPTHRASCRVASFTADQLTCKSPFGSTRIYKSQEIAALILPGDYNQRFPFVIGFNTAAGFAVWGTVALVATCIPCAAATALAAILFLGAAGACLIADDVPDSLLYLAPGLELHVKGYVSMSEMRL